MRGKRTFAPSKLIQNKIVCFHCLQQSSNSKSKLNTPWPWPWHRLKVARCTWFQNKLS
ncbi:hypothetical protein HanPI659440_Chr16g0653251 [Helianthus annuus]|nr:hypothetical protein HanPI659440_Chr16g0653251 [Helianthus annuus]